MDASRFGNGAYDLGISRPLDPTDSGNSVKSADLADGISARVNRRALVMGRLGGTLLTEHSGSNSGVLYSEIRMSYEPLQLRAGMTTAAGSSVMKPYGIYDGADMATTVALHAAWMPDNSTSAVDFSARIGAGTIGYQMAGKVNVDNASQEYKTGTYGNWYMPVGTEASFPSVGAGRGFLRPEAIGIGKIVGADYIYGYAAWSVNVNDGTRMFFVPRIAKMFDALELMGDIILRISLRKTLVVGGGAVGGHATALNTTTLGGYGEIAYGMGETTTTDRQVFAGNVLSLRAGYANDMGSQGVGGMPIVWISINGK